MPNTMPIYIEAYKKGLLKEKIKQAQGVLSNCTLCPRKCCVDRLSGETGICKTGKIAFVSSFAPHFGEEAPLVGTMGSGTIFFTHCNLLCNFCQNYDISHEGQGTEISDNQLAAMMIQLQDRGCHNINFVTPSHVVPQILSALEIAIEDGLSIPLVYNTSGFDSVNTLKILEGVIDIYMPDFKFWDPKIADITCKAGDYPEVTRMAVTEMHRQVGDLLIDDSGITKKGLLIRHLVLPEGLAGTRSIMSFIVMKISKNSYVNIMPQYRPCGSAYEIKELSCQLSQGDYESALQSAKDMGVTRIDSPRRVYAIK